MNAISLREWLGRAPYTLSMGAGFFGFYAHAGVLLALDHAGLLPARLTGSSAGAMVAALFASGKTPESIVNEMLPIRRRDFWDPGAMTMLQRGGFLKGERYGAILKEFLNCQTFEECVHPLCISVFDIAAAKTRFIQKGNLVQAVRASTSYPLLFRPLKIRGRWCSDGGVRDMPALGATQKFERVLCHSLCDHPPLSTPKRKVIDLSPLPSVHPFKMEQGARAIEAAYSKMTLRLDERGQN